MHRYLRKILSSLPALLLCGTACGQVLFPLNSGYGLRAGLVMAFGTHYQRLGFVGNFYYVNNQVQANTEIRMYYNFRNPGPVMTYPEIVLSQGLVFAYGGSTELFNPFLSSVSNQTRYLNCVAYSYNWWYNRVRTKQKTGVIHLGFSPVSLIVENDILAKPASDRFRSGGVLIQYRQGDIFQAALTSAIWTGHYRKKAYAPEVPEFYNGCYMDTVQGIYTSVSHGMLSAQIMWHLPYTQYLQANAGLDAEQIRNALQNRLMHNMKFLPKKLNKNCHLPMFDKKGGPYLYRPEQKIRKTKPFINVFTNANLFY